MSSTVCNRLKEIRKDFKKFVETDGVVLAICGGYQLLGNFYETKDGKIEGLGLVDLYTVQKRKTDPKYCDTERFVSSSNRWI